MKGKEVPKKADAMVADEIMKDVKEEIPVAEAAEAAVPDIVEEVQKTDSEIPIPKPGEKARKEFHWDPKTRLGRDVVAGKYKTVDEILMKGELILEPEIIDALIPDYIQEVVYIGGSPGKGGGIRRTATKMTARMHKSGRRFTLGAFALVGNANGIIGIGRAVSKEHRTALEKALKNAKLGVIRVRRGCGSWECGCGGEHSVPFKVSGSSGSVHVTILPAPKGVGLVASEEGRKILKIAGIKDAWVKTSGQTATRNNLAIAIFNALRNLNSGKGDL
jgi:small subunit ribosomal protein S5